MSHCNSARAFTVTGGAHSGGIDRNGAGLGRGVDLLARVQLERLEVLGEVGHVDEAELGAGEDMELKSTRLGASW